MPLPTVSPAGHCLELGRAPSGAGFYQLHPPPATPKADTEPGAGDSLTSGDAILGVCSDKWAFVATKATDGIGITGHLISTHNSRRYARLRLNGAALVNARLTDETLTVSDNRGRVVVLSLEDGSVLRNLRV